MSVVPGHDHLIDQWVSQELHPLFSQHRTLAAKSIQRKIGALRAGVEATLRWRLEHAERCKRRGADELHTIELDLRKAAGAFGEVRSRCESLFDPSLTVLDEILRAAAEAARARIEAALRARIGDQVAEALRSHGTLLQIWATRVLTQFRKQFDAHAQVYGSQLVQSAEGAATPEGDLGGMSRDLQEISTTVEASK